MRPIHWRLTKPALFAILMAVAALLALLPAHWTGCTDGLMQPVSPITWVFSGVTRRGLGAADSLSTPAPTRAEYERLRQANQRLAQQVGQQHILIAEMEQVVAELSGLREEIIDPGVRILFAAVSGGDASPQRETLTISIGSRRGVAAGDWVAAGLPPAERDPAATGRDLLLQQWVIGVIDEVQPYLSRVQLATDPEFGTRLVRVAKPLSGTRWEVAELECGLVGLGQGRMRIDRAAVDYLGEGYTIVLVPLAHPQPLALALGRIVGSEPLETGLHYDFEVEPWSDARRLSHVYVISFPH
jgi:cell shape-determining protein MreC